MKYDREVSDLIADLKNYAKEAIKNNYAEFIVDSDLTRLISSFCQDIIDGEEEMWHERWEDAVDEISGILL